MSRGARAWLFAAWGLLIGKGRYIPPGHELIVVTRTNQRSEFLCQATVIEMMWGAAQIEYAGKALYVNVAKYLVSKRLCFGTASVFSSRLPNIGNVPEADLGTAGAKR